MADPITISAAVVGTAFLVEDVKFLWKQADTITTRYNERKYRQIDDAEQAKIKVEDTPAVLQPAPELTIDFDRAQEKGAKMVMLSEALEPYAKGQKVARADDPDLLQTMDALQQMIDRKEKIDVIFAIGPLPMMSAVAELTRPLKIKTMVSLNPIMVDGTGMCGGCRVTVGKETKFTCVDGPEFDGHLVDFAELKKRQQSYIPQEKKALEQYEKLHNCKLEMVK